MKQLYFDQEPLADFSDLLCHYDVDEFASPWRSTIPLLSLVKHNGLILEDIAAHCHLPKSSHYHFEYQVKPTLGRGKPSHTDLMIQSERQCLAVEAKWTEPMYETVATWLRRKKHPQWERLNNREGERPSNRKNVLAGWLKLLSAHAKRKLETNDFANCVYQMIHRAASACEGMKHPQLAYLMFLNPANERAEGTKKYQDALQMLHSLLGNPPSFPFYLIEVNITPTAAFELIAKLPKGSRDTATKVRATLLTSKLFDFRACRIQKIGN